MMKHELKHESNVSSNVTGEQVQFFFIMYFVIIFNVRSQENVLLYLFRNNFENSWVNVYCDWSDVKPQPYHPAAQARLPTEAK